MPHSFLHYRGRLSVSQCRRSRLNISRCRRGRRPRLTPAFWITNGRTDFCQLGTGCGGRLEREYSVGGVGVGGLGVAGEDEFSEDRAAGNGRVGGTELRPQEELCTRVPTGSGRDWMPLCANSSDGIVQVHIQCTGVCN